MVTMAARRVLVLACLFLALAPLQSASGQEGGLAQAEGIDEVVESLVDPDFTEEEQEEGEGSGGGGDGAPEAEAEDVDGDGDGGDEEDVVEDFFEEAGDALSASEDVVAAAADQAAEEVEGASGGGDPFSKPLFKKRAKTGNKLCSWSWRERRCEPSAICQYKYQFLDATVSESCRLASLKLEREVFPTSDVQVKPAVALAGAAGFFAADLAAIRYTNWLQRFPLLFNVAQGFVLLFSGDTLFQVLEQGWQKVIGLRFWRMVRSGAIGALNNGLVHYSYYKWIDKRFPYDKFSEKRWGPADGARSKLAIGLSKWAIEWPTIGVYKIASMYIFTALLSGKTEGLWARMQDSFFLTWLRSLQVWPIYDMILYAYVPTAHRPLFNSFMSIAWGGYLSHVSQPHEADITEEDLEVPVETS